MTDDATVAFVALQDFHSPELKSDYVTGLTYRLQPGNEKLATMLSLWLEQGKVALAIANSRSRLIGKGEIS